MKEEFLSLQELNARQSEMCEAMEKQCQTEPEILHPIIPDLWVEITFNPRIIGVPRELKI